MSDSKPYPVLKKIGRGLYWFLPVLLIMLILHRIDMVQLKQNLTNLDRIWMFLALPLYPLSIFLGAMRWHYLLNRFASTSLPLRFAVIQHWAGYAVGLFTPGYTGWDAYRVYRGGKAVKTYHSGLTIIILERLTSLTSAMLILLIGAGFLSRGNSEIIPMIMGCGGILLLLSLAGLGLLYWENGHIVHIVLEWMKRTFRTQVGQQPVGNIPVRVRDTLRTRELLILFGFSFTIQLITIIVNYFLFHAIRNPLPLSVVAFSTPASLLITMLPISFGSVGVREFTYIYLYGLFDVIPEKAVLVAFFNLMGLLINGLIGATIFASQFERTKVPSNSQTQKENF